MFDIQIRAIPHAGRLVQGDARAEDRRSRARSPPPRPGDHKEPCT